MKGWRIAMLGLAVLLVAVVVVTFAVIKPMVTDMAIKQAEAMGFRNVSIDIDHLGPTRLHIASLTLGPGRALGARDITLLYSPLRVLSGHLDQVRIGDMFVAASLKSGDSVLPFMEGYKNPGGDIVLPVDRVEIDKSSLNIVSPAGDYELGFTGTVLGAENAGLSVNGAFKLMGGAGEADGTLTGRMDGSGAFDGSAQVAAVSFRAGALNVASGQAEITARGTLDGLDEANAQFALLNSRLGGVSLDTLDGEANYRPGATRLDLTLNSGNPRLSGSASLRVDTGSQDDPAEIAVNASLDAADFAGLQPAFGQPVTLSGKADLQLEGTVSDFASVSDDVANHVIPREMLLRGRLTLKSGRFEMPQSIPNASAHGSLDIAMDDGQLTFGSDEGVTLAADDWGSLQVTQLDSGTRRPLGVMGPKLQPGRMQMAAALAIDTKEFGKAEGTLDGMVVLDPAVAGVISAAPLDLHLTSEKPVTYGGMKISGLTIASTIRGEASDIAGDTTVSFGIDSATDKAMPQIKSGTARFTAKIGERDGAAYAVLNDCAMLSVKSVGAGSVIAGANAMSLCPEGPNSPLADLRYSAANGSSLALAGALRTGHVDVTVRPENGDPLDLDVTLSPISVHAIKPPGDAPLNARLTMDGGKVDLPDYLTRVQNAGFDLSVNAADTGWTAKLQKLKGQVVDMRQVALFTPLNFSAEGDLGRTVGKLTARLSDPSGKFVVAGSGTYDPASGNGSAEFHSGPITFAKNGLQPQALFPVLKGQVTSVTGDVGLNGKLAWKNGDLTSSGDVTISNLGLATFIASMTGLNASIAFDSLYPLSTPPGQKVTVAELNPGTPLNDGELQFQIRPGGDYVIEHMSWPWAGGRLYADDVHVRTGKATYRLPIRMENVDLARLVSLFDLKDLDISSTIGGELPVVIENGTPYIRKGELRDDGKGGYIRYRSQAAKNLFESGGPSASLAMKVLNNFNFKSAKITVDGSLTGSLDVGFHISGFNPDLYNGYPIEFNLGVQGKLGQLVRASMASLNVTRELQQRLKEGQ